jgi:4-hydroxybenzoate polyprenyltransferase
MAEIDKIKEETGWLKVIFALLVAIDVSLIGWAAQKFTGAPIALLLLSAIMVILVTSAIVAVNRRAYKKIDELGECDE